MGYDSIFLYEIENCYTDECVQGHSFTCVFGLLLMTLLTRKVQREYKEMSLPEIVELLSEIELVIIKYKGYKKTIKTIVEINIFFSYSPMWDAADFF